MKLVSLVLFCFFSISFAYSQEQFSVYFDSNKYELVAQQKFLLNRWIIDNPQVKIVAINGFCDEVGSIGSNDTLAKNRINYVFNIIKDKVKIRDDFKTRSFGELHKLSKIQAENRKVSIYYLLEKDLKRENEILGIKEIPKIEEVPLPKIAIKYPEKMSFENPDGTKTEYKMDVAFMQKIAAATVGEKLKIDNLNFQINTFIVVPASKGKLYELLTVLNNNPKLKIEIQGHLCCQPVDRLDLSTQRARAINNFLVTHGINENRLTFKGMGSSQPIFPLPEKDEAQRAANRRVEIMIVENSL